jgi:hypothetical protein
MIVRAKRLGWDEDPDDYPLLDPYDYDSDDLEGELTILHVKASKGYPAYTKYMVDGKSADPKTITTLDNEPIDHESLD